MRVVLIFACPPDRCRRVLLALAATTLAVTAAMAATTLAFLLA